MTRIEDFEDLLQQATDMWGEESQMLLAIEECGELIAVLSQYMRGRKTKADVIEEIADVSLVMRQLRLLFGQNEVTLIEINKIKRLKMRLERCDINASELLPLGSNNGVKLSK